MFLVFFCLICCFFCLNWSQGEFMYLHTPAAIIIVGYELPKIPHLVKIFTFEVKRLVSKTKMELPSKMRHQKGKV